MEQHRGIALKLVNSKSGISIRITGLHKKKVAFGSPQRSQLAITARLTKYFSW